MPDGRWAEGRSSSGRDDQDCLSDNDLADRHSRAWPGFRYEEAIHTIRPEPVRVRDTNFLTLTGAGALLLAHGDLQ